MGFSRYRFEQICEEQYNRYYKKAIQDIENGEYPHCSWITVNTFGAYVDFPVSEAYSIVRIWNDKLKNAVAEYQQKHEMRIEAQEAAEEQLRLQKEATEEHLRLQIEAAEENLRLEMIAAEKERKRLYDENHGKSLELLMAPPYNILREEAEKLINDDGEIDKDALKSFMNTQKNREHIAKKAAEWEAMKKQQPQTSQPAAVQAIGPRVCHACGACIVDSDKFCRACGAALQRQCPACKKLLPVANKFCSECGNKL